MISLRVPMRSIVAGRPNSFPSGVWERDAKKPARLPESNRAGPCREFENVLMPALEQFFQLADLLAQLLNLLLQLMDRAVQIHRSSWRDWASPEARRLRLSV